MARALSLVERGMEAQAEIRALRKACAPLHEAAIASGDWTVMAETQALAATLRAAGVQARRLTGFAENIACPDGRRDSGHGLAA